MFVVTQLTEHFLDMHAHLFRCETFEEAQRLAEDIAKQTRESEPCEETSGKAYIFALENTVTCWDEKTNTFVYS